MDVIVFVQDFSPCFQKPKPKRRTVSLIPAVTALSRPVFLIRGPRQSPLSTVLTWVSGCGIANIKLAVSAFFAGPNLILLRLHQAVQPHEA